ncbi:MAG: hypothetical protein D6B26_06275 [Spirochaetaceae bacterium]|nr:MAG: hypothetical protein D6B26_06275 [Spirochaetaceae bacterium]
MQYAKITTKQRRYTLISITITMMFCLTTFLGADDVGGAGQDSAAGAGQAAEPTAVRAGQDSAAGAGAAFAYLSNKQQRILARDGRLLAFGTRETPISLMPPLESTQAIRSRVVASPVISEILLFVPGNGTKDLTSSETRLALYNMLRSPSTMKGIEYYSASRKEMRTLFTDSYAIESPDTRRSIPDPAVQEVPTQDSLYFLQRDLTFGRNVYQANYYADDDSLRVDIINHATVGMGIIPVIMPEKMRMTIVIQPFEDALLVYGVVYTDPILTLGMQERIQRSLSNRLKAIAEWAVAETKPLL